MAVSGVDFLLSTRKSHQRIIGYKGGAGVDTFQLVFDGVTSAAIKETASTAQLATKLTGMSNITASDISVAGTPNDWTINFQGQYFGQAVPKMEPTAVSGTYTVEVTHREFDPSVFGFVSSSTQLNSAFGVALSGNYAYVASLNSDSLTVVDISQPATPSIVGFVSSSTQLDGPRTVALSGNYAYVASVGSDSLTAVDISQPATPSIVGFVSSSTQLDGAHGVTLSGNYAYVASLNSDSLTVVDISQPPTPSIVGFVSSSTQLDSPRTVALSGNYAYVASTISDSLTVVDIESLYGTPVALAGQRNATLDMSINRADATTKDSNKWSEGEQLIREWSIDADGLVTDESTGSGQYALRKAWENNYPIKTHIKTPSGKYYIGESTLSFSEDAPHDDLVSSSVTLTGKGSLQRSPQ